MDPRNIPEIEKSLLAAQRQYFDSADSIRSIIKNLASYQFLSTYFYPASYGDDAGYLMLAKKLCDAGDNIAQTLKDFPAYDEWCVSTTQEYEEQLRTFNQNTKTPGTLSGDSFYDEQRSPPSIPNTSNHEYEEKKSEYLASKNKCIESFKTPAFKSAIEKIKTEQDSMQRSQAKVEEYSVELDKAVTVFLTKTQETVNNLNFWNKQGKAFLHGLFGGTKTPASIDGYRKILNSKTISQDDKWEAIQNWAASKLKEYEARSESDKGSDVLIKLHKAILSKDFSQLAKVASEVQPTLDVHAKPKMGGSEKSY